MSQRVEQQPNLLKDPIPRTVRFIAIPASIGTVFTTLYNFVDTYWAGQLSTESLAALTPNFTIYLLVLAVGVGFSSGAGALMSNYIGEGKEERSRFVFAQVITFAFIMQIIVSVVLMIFLRPLFVLMSTSENVIPRAMAYGSVIVIGSMAMTFNMVFNSALSARGLSKPFRNALIVGFFLNLIFDPLLMWGVNIGGTQIIPALEERGIALATIIIQALTALYMLTVAVKAGALKNIKLKDYLPNLKAWGEIAGQVLPAALDFLTLAIGTLVINAFIGRYGTEVLAAYGTGLRVEQFALIPNAGIVFALSALVGQNNGAGHFDRVKRSFFVCLRYGLYVMVALLTPILIFGRLIISAITDNAEVIRIAYEYLLIQGITFYSYVILFQANSVLRGLKKPLAVMVVGVYRQVAAPFIFFQLFAVALGLEERGVWWALVVINWSAALITLFWAFRKIRMRMAESDTMKMH